MINCNDCFLSTTHTTRRPKNEREKLDYNCIKMQDFEQDVTQVVFLRIKENTLFLSLVRGAI